MIQTKNKKLLATILAASMLMGSSLTANAQDIAITGDTNQEVPMSMEVTAEDLENINTSGNVIVRVPARLTLELKSNSYISTDKVGAYGTLPSFQKVIISNENDSIEFKNADQSSTLNGKLTLGVANDDLIISSEELAAGKADANNIKYSQITAKVAGSNIENADTYTGTADLMVRIDTMRSFSGLSYGILRQYYQGDDYENWIHSGSDASITCINDGTHGMTDYYDADTCIKNYKEVAQYVYNNSGLDYWEFYKPDVKKLLLSESSTNPVPTRLDIVGTDSNRTASEYQTLFNEGKIVENLDEVFVTPFMSMPKLELLIINCNLDLQNSIKDSASATVNSSYLSSKYYNGIYFANDYDKDNNLIIYIPNIVYRGTMAEWNAIPADGGEWNFPKMENTVTVYCTDGTITYE